MALAQLKLQELKVLQGYSERNRRTICGGDGSETSGSFLSNC